MSAGEKSEKTSSVDSGSSQNYTSRPGSVRVPCHVIERAPYAGPVLIVGRNLLGLREAEDALFKAEFGVGRAHWDASLGCIQGAGDVGELGEAVVFANGADVLLRSHMLARHSQSNRYPSKLRVASWY
jgi:hypothetical protein